MEKRDGIVFAAKSAPDEKILADIQKAGLKAVEVYLSKDISQEYRKLRN